MHSFASKARKRLWENSERASAMSIEELEKYIAEKKQAIAVSQQSQDISIHEYWRHEDAIMETILNKRKAGTWDKTDSVLDDAIEEGRKWLEEYNKQQKTYKVLWRIPIEGSKYGFAREFSERKWAEDYIRNLEWVLWGRRGDPASIDPYKTNYKIVEVRSEQTNQKGS